MSSLASGPDGESGIIAPWPAKRKGLAPAQPGRALEIQGPPPETLANPHRPRLHLPQSHARGGLRLAFLWLFGCRRTGWRRFLRLGLDCDRKLLQSVKDVIAELVERLAMDLLRVE